MTNIFAEIGGVGLDHPVFRFLMAFGFIIVVIYYYLVPKTNRLVKI